MKALRNDFFRALTGRGFYIAVFILCLMQYMGQRENFLMGRGGSLICNVTDMLGGSPMNWVYPGIGALCFSDACIRDIDTGSLRYQLVRLSLARYVISKMIVCFSVACLSTVLATAVYTLLASRHFDMLITPEEVAVYTGSYNSFDALITQGRYIEYLIIHIFCEGLCAGMWATTGMLLSVIWKNKYVAIIAPTVLIYAKDYLYAWIGISFNILRPFQLGYIAMVPGIILPLMITAGVFIGIAAVIGCALYLVMRRLDYA